MDRRAVDAQHGISALQACRRCGRAFVDRRDQRAGVLLDRLRVKSPPGVGQPARLHQLARDPQRAVDGDGEPDSLSGREDRRADADHIAVGVDQRPARVAGVDRGVGLDEIVIAAALGVDRPVQRRDHAGADALVQAERVADGDGRLTEHEIGGAPERRRGELLFALDLEHGEVAAGIGADHFGGEVGAVFETDLDAAPARDDVIVRQYEPSGIKDESGTERSSDLISGAHAAAEKERPRIVGGRSADDFLRVDIDDEYERRAPRRAGTSGQRRGEEQREHAELPGRSDAVDGAELRLHRSGLFCQIVQRFQVPGVLLLVEQPALDVALDHAAIEVPDRDFLFLLGH